MKQPKITEQELAQCLIKNLQEWGWTIYQEVEGPGGRVDIVAARDKIQWAIEAKLSFGFPVIEQAYNWRRQCHYSSVAVPWKSAGYRGLAKNVCKNYGIGVIRIEIDRDIVEESVKPKLNRKPHLLKLYEEQKTFCEAGSSKGGQWTPFKRTCRELINLVRAKPGVEFNELIKTLDHHYSSLSSAKSCLRGFIGTVIPELRTETVNNKLCVFIAE